MEKRTTTIIKLFFIIGIAMSAIGASMATTYTTSQVAQHSTSSNCWTIIDGKIYDMTAYITAHPGGQGIAAMCGIDGTQMFYGMHPTGSQLSAISTLLVGTVGTAPNTTNTSVNSTPVITVLGSNPATVVVNTTYTDAGATAFDSKDGSLTANITTTSNVNTAVAGTYTVTYTVKNSLGNNATATRTVIVQPPRTGGHAQDDSDDNESDEHEHAHQNRESHGREKNRESENHGRQKVARTQHARHDDSDDD